MQTQTKLSLKEVAKLLGISVKSMKIRVATGKFQQPDERVNGELYWTINNLRGVAVGKDAVTIAE